MAEHPGQITPDQDDLRERLRLARQRVQDAESRHIHDVDEKDAELAEAVHEMYAAYIDAAVTWLERKWGAERPCPYCHSVEWSVSRPFNLLLESREALAPHFSVVCTNCGNTVLVNAVLAGLFEGPEQA